MKFSGGLVLVLVASACSAPLSVRGHVALAGVADFSGVTVSLSQGQQRLSEVVTGADGAYRFEVAQAGLYTLGFHDEFSVERDYSFDVLVYDAPVQAPDTVLHPLGRVVGSARPLSDCPGLTLTLTLTHGAQPVATDLDGGFELVLPSGANTLEFSWAAWSQSVEVQVPHGTAVEMQAPSPPRTASIQGRMRRDPLPPPSGARVNLSETCAATTLTNAAGEFTLSSLPAGPYIVTSEPPPFSWARILRAQIQTTASEGQVRDVGDIIWTPTATVRGRVTKRGAPVPYRTVCSSPSLENEWSRWSNSAQADADGGYELEVPLGVNAVGVIANNIVFRGRCLLSDSVPVTAMSEGQVVQAPDIMVMEL